MLAQERHYLVERCRPMLLECARYHRGFPGVVYHCCRSVSRPRPCLLTIPMRFQRRGGCKRIVAPDGSPIMPASKPQPDGALVKVLAGLAVAADPRWRRLQLCQRDRRCRERLEELRESDLTAGAAGPRPRGGNPRGHYKPGHGVGAAGAAGAAKLGGAAAENLPRVRRLIVPPTAELVGSATAHSFLE
jgi:hypothetical protein